MDVTYGTVRYDKWVGRREVSERNDGERDCEGARESVRRKRSEERRVGKEC